MSLINEIKSCLNGDINEDTCKLIFLRASVNAENEAINLYRAIADATDDPELEETMEHVAEEEEVHVGEFEQMLYDEDPEYAENVQEGVDEVKGRH